MFDCEKELSSLENALNLLKQHTEKVKAKVEQSQYSRQKDIWRLVSNLSEVSVFIFQNDMFAIILIIDSILYY